MTAEEAENARKTATVRFLLDGHTFLPGTSVSTPSRKGGPHLAYCARCQRLWFEERAERCRG